jgi:multidrug efflux pump
LELFILNLSKIFIERPIATSLLMLAIVITGALAYRLLPISSLPQVDYPTIQVTTLYPGASPEVVTSSITAPLERQFGQMPGLDEMSSVSSGGASVITLRFSLDLTLDIAEQQVQAAINAGGNLLPTDLPMPPIYSKVNPADAPILTLAVSSPTLPITQVHDMVENRIAQRLSQISGVGLVSLAGGRRPAVRVQVNPGALSKSGFSLEDIRAAIAQSNVNMAKGSFDGPNRASTLDANDQMRSAKEYAKLIIAFKNGSPLRLEDVATLSDAPENIRLAAWANQKDAIIINVQRQPGANVIETVDKLKATLPNLKANLPESLDLEIMNDRTQTIRASVSDVQIELMISVVLVVLVIFIFLRSAQATLIPSVAVPLSLLGTFGVMYLLGFSVNNLTLMAMTIATGFVVDDAIVMIENIARHIEMGKSPYQAALEGAREIGFTIISLTFSLIAVLIPLLFMGDVVGRLFHEFAVTLAVAILISAVVSLSLTPMMCSKILKPHAQLDASKAQEKKPSNSWSDHMGHWIELTIAQYAKALDWVLERPKETWGVFLGTLVLTGVLYGVSDKGFFPEQDTGSIQVITEASQASSFKAMQDKQREVAQVFLEDRDVQGLTSFIGVDGQNMSINTGRMMLVLKPKRERQGNQRELIERLNSRVALMSGVRVYFQPIQDLTLDDRVAKAPYAMVLSGPDTEALGVWSERLKDRLSARAELSVVVSDLQAQGLQAYVRIDREAAGRLGVSIAAIDNALYDAFGQRLISTIYTQSNQYRVVLELEPSYRSTPKALEQLFVPSTTGAQIPMSTLARVEEKPTRLGVMHMAQYPAVTLSFLPAKGVSLGEAVQVINTELNALRASGMPINVESTFEGAALAFQNSLSNTLWLILAAIVTMYIVLGVLYESYIHPVTILSTLPSAGVGALLALWLSRMDLGVIAVIGVILLIGIVKKNAIMMIDFALDAERTRGLSPREAIFEACLLRFRPILMTTLCALLGALPLILGGGVGSELRQPLGVTMVGGLMLSQLMTLFTTPVIYLTFSQWFPSLMRQHEHSSSGNANEESRS